MCPDGQRVNNPVPSADARLLKDWDWKHKAACGLAKSFDYSEALDMLDEIQPKWLFCLGTNRHAAVREAWSTLAGPQRDLQNGAKKEKDARKVLIDLENAKKALYESRKSLAEEAWKDYQTERAKTEAKRAEIQMNENGVPILDGVLVATKEDVQKLLRCYDDATAGWKRTAGKLVAACAGIDAQEAAREQAEREGREAQARKERRLAIMKEISGTLGHAQKEERLAKTKLLLAEEANAGLKFGDGNASIDWENYQYYRNLAAKSGGEAIRFDETDRLPYREVDGNRVYLGEKEIRQLPETIRAAAKNWQQAAADFEKACKRHEAALQEARQNLGRAFQQAMNTENRLSALEKDARYEAVQKDRKTVPAWNHYVTFAIKANEEMDSIPWFNDREPPFPEADKLENDQLLDLYGKLRKVIFYRLNACTLLKKAYEILDEEKADAGWKAAEEEAVEMPGADTGTTPSSDVAPEGGGGGGGEEGPEVEPGFFGRTLRGVGMGLKTGMNPDRWFSQDSDADGTKEENP